MEDLVSVVIPAYNCAKYIGEAIESVINQTYQNWELIIVNDGSTDETESVIALYAQKDKRIHYFNNEVNSGVAKTRLRAFERASGDYIALLDSDDKWEPCKTELQMKLIKEKDAVLVYSGCRFISEEGRSVGKPFYVPAQVGYRGLLYRNCIPNLSVIARRDEIVKAYHTLPSISDNRYYEDYLTCLKMLDKGKLAFGIDQLLVVYRKTNNSRSRNKVKAAKMHYKTLRLAGINPIHAAYYFLFYAVNGIRKYQK